MTNKIGTIDEIRKETVLHDYLATQKYLVKAFKENASGRLETIVLMFEVLEVRKITTTEERVSAKV